MKNRQGPHVGLVLDREAGIALERILAAVGYEVYLLSPNEAVRRGSVPGEADIWLFDVNNEDLYDPMIASGRYMVPVERTPPVSNEREFARWAESIMLHIHIALAEEFSLSSGQHLRDNWSQVEAVWVLAGSAGATSAVQEFLNTFRELPPVAFIYAQHYDPDLQYQLHQFSPENPLFTMELGEGIHQLAAGKIVMVPPSSKVSIDASGLISSTRSQWEHKHTPDIDELLVILTAANLPSAGVVVFSGMGNDGAEGLRIFDSSGARIWAQHPETAICDSMPQAAIDTGLVHRTGSPAQLAFALEQIHNP